MENLEHIQTSFFFLLFSFAIIFSFFTLFLHLLRFRRYCKCNICDQYLTRDWSKRFLNLCDWYTHLLKQSPTSTIHIHILNNVITSNPLNVQHILKTQFNNYPKGRHFSTLLGDLLGQGIFNVDGENWRFQRKLASLELGSVSVRAFAHDVITEEIQNRLIPLLESFSGRKDETFLDLQDVFRRFSFDTISKFSFGFDPRCLALPLPASEFALAFDAASRLSAERALAPSPLVWKIKRFLNIGSEKKLKDSIQTVNKLSLEYINQRRKMSSKKKNDLLSRFMAVVDDDEYLRDITVNFVLAGRDTVAAALTAFFWLLTKYPEVESRIRDEMGRVVGLDTKTSSFDEMREMHYLNAALYETMRLYPPVQFDSKFALNDDVLADGTVIKEGMRVTYHPYAMGRMERVWGLDCEEFKPERWLVNGRFKPENPFKYPVFQAGVRVCLGKEMALMEMKSVALAVIRRFDIRVVDPGRVPRFVPGLTASVSGGLPVLVQERRDWRC